MGALLPVATTVRREVTRSDAVDTSRADVAVRSGETVLVRENKVWAAVSVDQCEALYRH